MLLGAAAFAGTALLGAGDLLPFLAVCVLTGLMLGADLAFPAALLTDALRARRAEAQAASYFGVWTFATKMTAALAAGVGLPLVGALGYLPGQSDSALGLQAVYCLLPCALKVAAAGVLSSSVRVRTQGALS
jgi:Na+/melibiose symporter-like transporter